MTISQPFDFDPFYSNRLFSFKLVSLNILARFRNFLGRRLHGLKHQIRTGIIAGLYKDMGKIYLMVEGLQKLIETSEISLEQAKEGHKATEKILNKFKHYYYLLEEVNFFDHSGVEDVSNKLLLDLYAIESKLRFRSFDDNKDFDGDEELRKTASLISLNATQSLHAV